MKKGINLVVIFMGIVFASCSKDMSLHRSLTNPETSIITQLQRINDSLKEKNTMRSGGTGLKRKQVTQADALAAEAAALKFAYETVSYYEKRGWTFSQIQSYMLSNQYKYEFEAYVSSASQSASKKAAKNSGDCAIIAFLNPSTSNTYEESYLFLKEKECTNTDSIILKYNIEIIDGIELPTSFEDIQYIGVNHNGIINKSIQQSSHHGRRSSVQPVDFPILYPESEIDILFSTEAFQTQFFDFGDLIDDCLDSYTLNPSMLFENYPQSCSLAIQIGEMFYNAILYCNSHNDILYLANNYIDSIENDNTLTIHDKRALYSSFVVAVYSYSLWGEYMDLASLENIS